MRSMHDSGVLLGSGLSTSLVHDAQLKNLLMVYSLSCSVASFYQGLSGLYHAQQSPDFRKRVLTCDIPLYEMQDFHAVPPISPWTLMRMKP